MKVANKECSIQIGMMISATTNMEGVNAKEIEIEIKGNEVKVNRQSDYLQAI